MNKSISIIIPNYNGAQILPQNLPKVIQVATKYNAPIIIVDDKSTDNSVDMLKKDFSQITLIEKEINQGFSSTVNVGVNHAKTDLVCLLNSDVILTDNCLDPLFSYFDDPLTVGVGMQDFSDDQQTHGRGRFIFHRGFLLHERFSENDNNLKSGETGWVSCGSGVFSKKIWDELGGLDELLNPFYFEDVDFGYRAWKCGYKLYFEANSHVDHVHKKGSIKSNYEEERIKSISYRNQMQFTLKNLTDIDLIIQHKLWMVVNKLSALRNHDNAYLKGLKEAQKNSKEIGEKRRALKEKWTKTDREILTMLK